MVTSQLVGHCEAELARLAAFDVFSDAFAIGGDGLFGTINGLRLGRLPAVAVEWAEINGALGQVVLLLCTLARAHSLTFSSYALVPMGSYSKARVLPRSHSHRDAT